MAANVANHFDSGAFEHNRMFKTKKRKLIGCHDLHYLLKAQSRGLVVASVAKLPGDKLPKGVYTALVTCRPDVDPPDSDKQQDIAPHGEEVWEMVRCSNCDCIKKARTTSSNPGCKRNGILFKFEPYLKTIYDPEDWSDDRLADSCLKAYSEAQSMGRLKTAGEVTYWEGKVTENGQEFWMGGFLKNGKIKNFYFIHPDDRELKNVA